MERKIHVLFVEDSEDDALLMLRELRRGGFAAEYQRVETEDEMRRALAVREWDAIISDHRMPHFSSTGALALLGESGKDVPFIIVSGAIGEDAVVAAMKAGAVDYVPKDDLKRLAPAIEREVANAEYRRIQLENERRLRERQELVIGILSILNGDSETPVIINDMLKMVKDFSGMEAVSIRLRQGEDYPHIAHYGFTDEFIREERSLCARTEAGEILRDEKGGVILECMCGTVISGRTDPAMPFFSAQGSFWTNNSSEYLKHTEDVTIEIVNARNKCINDGYESIALVPLRSGKDIIGLLQLNDRRRGRFTLELVEFFEQVGMTIGIALKRRMTEDAIRESEERYSVITNSMHDMVWLMDMNFRTTFVSPSVTRLRGYTLDELSSMPLERHLAPKSLDRIAALVAAELNPGRLADKNCNISMTVELEFYRKDGSTLWCENTMTLIRNEDGAPQSILGVGRDITERKRMEDELHRQLKELRRWQEVMIGREDRVLGLKKEVNELLEEAGKPARYGGTI